jgi:hypothetical protein
MHDRLLDAVITADRLRSRSAQCHLRTASARQYALGILSGIWVRAGAAGANDLFRCRAPGARLGKRECHRISGISDEQPWSFGVNPGDEMMSKYFVLMLALLIGGRTISKPPQDSYYGGGGPYDYDNYRDVHGFPLGGWAQLFL